MTKNRNGFTLVELLATIVILGILVLIAIPAYNVISNNVKKRQNENKISYIETQAAKYVAESGLYSNIDETSITVQTLLQNGYLDGDNKIGDKVEDAYGNDITCYQIKISFEKGKPVPEFIDKNVLNQDGVCIINDLLSKKVLELDAYKIDQLNDNNKIEIRNHRTVWVDNNVVLKLKINDTELNSKRDQAIISIDWNAVNNNKSYSQSNDNWYTTGWLDNITSYNGNTEYKNVYTVSTSKIMADTKFKISLVVNYLDDNGKKINETLTSYLIVRIDKLNPTVTATADTNWTKGNKKIFITGNDKQGSGINHFCIFTSNTSEHTCNQGDASYVPLVNANSNKGEVTKAKGTYYVWAVDNVGNYSVDGARVDVDNIDTTKPTCVYENQNTSWKMGSQVITVKCSDESGGSGCITKPYNVTFADNTYSSANLPSSYIITDYAGNKATCSGPVNVYIDNNDPTINTLTYEEGVTTIKVSDTEELSKYEIINSNNSVIKTVTLSGTYSETTYNSVAAGTYTLKVYDKAGNTTSKNFTIDEPIEICDLETTEFEFDYTGAIQSFKAPCKGAYQLEVWGAQGGKCRSTNGGKGGYAVGSVVLNKDQMVYIGVGGQAAQFNGGGRGTAGTSNPSSGRGQNGVNGGGATHMALVSGELATIGYTEFVDNNKGLIVAGGGGGSGGQVGWEDDGSSAQNIRPGGYGGGLNGGSSSGGSCNGVGGTQSGSSTAWCHGGAGFGVGGTKGSGGGGGFYGGGGGYFGAGGGGSSWIGGVTDGQTIAGNASMPNHEGTGTMTGNSGNGYAKITYLGE